MNSLQLEYFVAVAEEGTLKKAADRMQVSQSAVSVAISGFEQELGHYLFSRSRSGMILTEYGEKVFRQTKIVLGDMDVIKQITREEDDQIPIKVAFVPAFAGAILGNAMTEFRRIYPNAKVELNERRLSRPDGDRTSVKDYSFVLIAKESYDKGFSSLSKKERIEEIVLSKSDLYAWVNVESPLVERETLRAEDCRGKMLLAQHSYIEELEKAIPGMEVNDYLTASIPRYVCTDVEAIGFVPSIFGIDNLPFSEACPMVPRKIDFFPRSFTYCVFHDARKILSAPEKTLIELIKKESIKQIHKTEEMAIPTASR